jgi:hypothetical protein
VQQFLLEILLASPLKAYIIRSVPRGYGQTVDTLDRGFDSLEALRNRGSQAEEVLKSRFTSVEHFKGVRLSEKDSGDGLVLVS